MPMMKSMPKNPLKQLFNYFGVHCSRASQRSVQMALVALLVCAVGGSGWWAYRAYQGVQERAAQLVFSRCSKQLEVARASGAESDWQELQLLAHTGHADHSGTRMAPYFLLLESHALSAQGKLTDAVQAMEGAVKGELSTSPLAGMLQLRKTLMQIDVDAQSGATAGLHELEALAQDEKNGGRDAAMFYLGLYHWSHDNVESARSTWSALVSSHFESEVSATWAQAAQQRIEHLPQSKDSNLAQG